MKILKINIPTTWGDVKCLFKWVKSPSRTNHNIGVMRKLNNELCNELSSGYWKSDISETMVERFTSGCPNGVIYKLITKALNDLK